MNNDPFLNVDVEAFVAIEGGVGAGFGVFFVAFVVQHLGTSFMKEQAGDLGLVDHVSENSIHRTKIDFAAVRTMLAVHRKVIYAFPTEYAVACLTLHWICHKT